MQLQIMLLFVQTILIPAYLVAIFWRGRESNKSITGKTAAGS